MVQEIRRIPLEGLRNTRDLGGYRTESGRIVKPHRLLRSGQLYGLTERDREILTGEYGLAVIVDFRTEVEIAESPDPELPGVEYIHIPILEEKTLGLTREKEADRDAVSMVLDSLGETAGAGIRYMEHIYGNLITNGFSKKQYAEFFRILLEQEEGAVLWHCTAGKDRAGTASALLLEALGVPREQNIADYLKVNEFLAEDIERNVEELVKKTGSAGLGEQLRALFTVQESYIRTIFGIIDKGYGTTERFLEEEMGFGEDAMAVFRDKYLTDGA